MAIMVAGCAILGTVAMGMMFDPAVINESQETFDSYAANGAYWAFQRLGEYYHVGDLFLVLYALCNMIGQFAILILSIDAPLRMLLDNEKTKEFIPSKLLKKNKYGAFSNGIWLVVILSGAIILIQTVMPGAASVLQQLTRLNSVGICSIYCTAKSNQTYSCRIPVCEESKDSVFLRRMVFLCNGGMLHHGNV